MSAPMFGRVSSRIFYNSPILYKNHLFGRIKHTEQIVNCYNTCNDGKVEFIEHSESNNVEVEKKSENFKSDVKKNNKASKRGRRKKSIVALTEKYNLKENSEESEKVVFAPFGVIRMDSNNKPKTKRHDETKHEHLSGYIDQTSSKDFYGIQNYEKDVLRNDFWNTRELTEFEEHASQSKSPNQLIGSKAEITTGSKGSQGETTRLSQTSEIPSQRTHDNNAIKPSTIDQSKDDHALNYFDVNTDPNSKAKEMPTMSAVDKEQSNYFDQLLIPEGLEQSEKLTPDHKIQTPKAENCAGEKEQGNLNYFDELLLPDKNVLNEGNAYDLETMKHEYIRNDGLNVVKERENAVHEKDNNKQESLDKTDVGSAMKTKNKSLKTKQNDRRSDVATQVESGEENIFIDNSIEVKPKNQEQVIQHDQKSNAFEEALKIRRELKNQRSIEAKRLKEEVENEIGTREGPKAKFSGPVDSKGFRLLTNQVVDFSNTPSAMIAALLHKNILYQDDNLLVIDKPYGLSCKGNSQGPNVEKALPELSRLCHMKSSKSSLQIVHSQDTTVTGIIILTKNHEALTYLKGLKQSGEIVRKYWLLTKGIPSPLEGVIDIPMKKVEIDGAYRMALQPERTEQTIPLVKRSRNEIHRAVTRYAVLDSNKESALVECQPVTDVLHQIRCHMAFGLNTPILGDHRYSHISRIAPQRLYGETLQSLGIRQAKVRHLALHLHATSVVLPHFLGGKNIFIKCLLPKHFATNMKRLKISPNKKS
ncbi:unnamed protein product [Owenia fusiformis]|uniref:Pseudouridylate synthase RPUSD4, mitochondrial n=1 Tax=Owenia fusiformis TaxID=6347 RepID=A0A8J1UYB9_OWEFU|nr:unnamed protein product [Owenia fusiformis]